MMRITMSCLILLTAITIHAQHLRSYQLFDGNGKRVSFTKMARKLANKDVILFGEIHDNPIDHWLQIELVKNLHSKRNLILGAEMFESEDQAAINSYLRGDRERLTDDKSMDIWPNYGTDYAPLVEFAKKEGLPFIATNVPDQFAKTVYFSGLSALDTLGASDRSHLAPLPIPFDKNLKTYQAIFTLWPDHATDELVMAQALKDATMAHFVSTNHRNHHLFFHINGTYHSEHQEGIYWYLKHYNPNLKCATIATVEQASVHKLAEENLGLADFIICVDEEMTETH